jgi:phosphatidate cytidylyltransferase
LFFAAEQKRIFLSFLAVDYLLIIILICLELLSTKNNKLENVSVSIFPLIYNAVGFSSLNFIAFWPKHHFNPYAILAFFAIIWATDISAFFFGSWLGKKPLAKNISPKKTIEGTIAGIAAGFITAIVESLLIKQFPLSLGIILGLLIPISGTIGDLLESAIKRQMQVKDSGSIMPGHGGLLDRFDSTTLAAALTALTLLFFAKL